MDAHVQYPRDYISSLVALLEKSGADNVGGVCQTLPAGGSVVARAVAVGMSHPLGVGNSHFRIGAAEDRWVDTVPFGCYRREVFDRIGLFDEELVRNQDDELNLRLIKHGGRILLSPRIVCKYYARDSLSKLWRHVLPVRLLQAAGRAKAGRGDDASPVVAAAVFTVPCGHCLGGPLEPFWGCLPLRLSPAATCWRSVRPRSPRLGALAGLRRRCCSCFPHCTLATDSATFAEHWNSLSFAAAVAATRRRFRCHGECSVFSFQFSVFSFQFSVFRKPPKPDP